MLGVLERPEDDDARRALADNVRNSDPALAEFIERQLDLSARVRSTRDRPGVARIGDKTHEEAKLLNENRQRWTRELLFYLGELPSDSKIEFSRGLPWLCSMNPFTFLEKGEYILSRIAPLRGIAFFKDPEGAPFPAQEIAQSPLLNHLDEIRFHAGALGERDLEIIAASQNLARVMTLDIRRNWVSREAWEALAANPLTRKCLMISSSYLVPSDGGPIGECSARFDIYPNRYFEESAEGRALEKAYGYIPWLHQENVCDPAHAHYWVEHNVLPLFVPGSAYDAPTPFGSGLWESVKREPRARFDKRDFDAVS